MDYYVIFVYDQYYPMGGIGDLIGGTHETVEAAVEEAESYPSDWWDVVHVTSDGLSLVKSGGTRMVAVD